MKPSVSRDVHLRVAGVCWAAKITKVYEDGSVDLVVFPPADSELIAAASNVPEESDSRESHSFMRDIHGDQLWAYGGPISGVRWHWPERVE